jgi:hypothetical protein
MATPRPRANAIYRFPPGPAAGTGLLSPACEAGRAEDRFWKFGPLTGLTVCRGLSVKVVGELVAACCPSGCQNGPVASGAPGSGGRPPRPPPVNEPAEWRAHAARASPLGAPVTPSRAADGVHGAQASGRRGRQALAAPKGLGPASQVSASSLPALPCRGAVSRKRSSAEFRRARRCPRPSWRLS